MQVPRSHAMHEEESPRQPESAVRSSGNHVKVVEEAKNPPSAVPHSPSQLGSDVGRDRPLGGRLPSRTESFAELGNLSWLNALISWLWPSFNRAVMEFVQEDLMPRLRDSLPSVFRHVHCCRFTLGDQSPELGPVQVLEHSPHRVDVVLGMEYLSDVDISFDAGSGISFGVRRLTCNGKMCVSLRPLMQRFPIAGAVHVFFAAAPQVDLELTGLASLGHFPGVEKTIRRAVADWLTSSMVLPRSKAVLLADDVDPMEALAEQPLGVVAVKVLRAENLAGVNCHAFKEDCFTSHPYCILSLGDRSVRSSTVYDTTHPVWPAAEPDVHFVVHHREQLLFVEVHGEASASLFQHNFTAFLGRSSCRIGHCLRRWPEEGKTGVRRNTQKLDTSQVQRDLLHVDDPVNRGLPSVVDVQVQWYDFVGADGWDDTAPAASAALVIELVRGAGFPSEGNVGRGLRWRTWVDDKDVLVSQKGQLPSDQLRFPDLPINPRLFPVIDNLDARRYSLKDMAQIVGIAEELVATYLRTRDEFKNKQEHLREVQSKDDYRIKLQWFQVLVHILDASDASKSLNFALLDSKDTEVGRLPSVPLRSLLEDSRGSTTLKSCVLQGSPEERGGKGCNQHRAAARGAAEGRKMIVPSGLRCLGLPWLGFGVSSLNPRFATVQMDISLRVCGLKAGRLPKV
ncbi:esyt3 [Symbiodinium natans]|uniref:Esyt3 protein n=1 Tax=Symbiodinium natans TaxID=878477 RepID=A0A812RRE4_9DINO|nr:esyt3 [Symbiodinium natans]